MLITTSGHCKNQLIFLILAQFIVAFLDSGKQPEHLLLWETQKSRYILKMMKIAYEEVPDEFVELSEARKGETDFNNFVKKHWPGNAPSKSPEIKGFMNVNVPVSSQECPEVSNEKSDILVLPISLQDESSTTGTASIL